MNREELVKKIEEANQNIAQLGAEADAQMAQLDSQYKAQRDDLLKKANNMVGKLQGRIEVWQDALAALDAENLPKDGSDQPKREVGDSNLIDGTNEMNSSHKVKTTL